MTKGAALQKFFEGFGIDAYPENAVPDNVAFPWLTYQPVFGAFGDTPLICTVKVWDYTSSEAGLNAKAEEISKKIGLGGVTVKCDDGLIWINRGEPFAQSFTDEEDAFLKSRVINLTLEYLTL